MKRSLKRVAGFVMSCVLSLSTVGIFSVQAADVNSYGGWFESMYASWADSNAKGAKVEYKKSSDSSYTTVDTELIRQYSSNARVDVVGLAKGTYDLKITTSSGDVITKTGISVDEYDRSGYAHFNYTDGVGAYNNDGTLKANAKVLYVTDENKNTVTVSSSDGTTVSGIGNILNSKGGVINKNSKGKVTSEVINTNQGIIKKLAQDGTPLVVRIVGKVTAPEGLTAFDSYDYGGTEGDNGFMARIQSGKDITIEGIGYDAEINGWGIHYICESSAPDLGKSFEVRNIFFNGAPEDAIGMEGQQSDSTITAGVERCWIHHCSFKAPKIANPAESDKAEGDGACDFKRGQYFTNSYCYYLNYHKTNLVGSSDSSLQYMLTYHHNLWENCESRGPLGRQANIHMYNNIFKGQTSYAMNTRANCYIFSESNLFYLVKNAMSVDAGAIKSYKDSFSGCINDLGGIIVTDKSQKVSSGNKYENFDTDSSLSYIPSGNYKLQSDVTDAAKVVNAYAGTMKETIVTPETVNASIIDSSKIPSAAVSLPYDKALNESVITSTTGTFDNIVFNANKIDKSFVSVGSCTLDASKDIVFKVDQPVNISMTDGGGTYPVMLLNQYGKEIITGTGTANNVPAGIYIIMASGISPSKTGNISGTQFKESKITALKIVSSGTVIPTETTTKSDNTTETTTKSDNTTETTTNNDTTTETTTSSPIVADNCVSMGTYSLNSSYITSKTFTTADNIAFDVRSVNSSQIKLRDNNTITFSVDRNCTLETDPAGDGISLTTSNGKITYNGSADTWATTTTDGVAIFTLTPGTYKLTGAGNGNTTLSYFKFTSTGSSSDPDPVVNDYYGDADNNGSIDATDAAYILAKARNFDYTLKIETEISNINVLTYFDLDGNGSIDATDAAFALQKARNADFVFPILR